jgi:hypothetical protein
MYGATTRNVSHGQDPGVGLKRKDLSHFGATLGADGDQVTSANMQTGQRTDMLVLHTELLLAAVSETNVKLPTQRLCNEALGMENVLIAELASNSRLQPRVYNVLSDAGRLGLLPE